MKIWIQVSPKIELRSDENEDKIKKVRSKEWNESNGEEENDNEMKYEWRSKFNKLNKHCICACKELHLLTRAACCKYGRNVYMVQNRTHVKGILSITLVYQILSALLGRRQVAQSADDEVARRFFEEGVDAHKHLHNVRSYHGFVTSNVGIKIKIKKKKKRK